MSNSNFQPEAVESALGVIKDTMIQYTNCADPRKVQLGGKDSDKLKQMAF